jgi:hypothetical protein
MFVKEQPSEWANRLQNFDLKPTWGVQVV